eukprot:9034150-Pyramimonas_sp.AAC.1
MRGGVRVGSTGWRGMGVGIRSVGPEKDCKQACTSIYRAESGRQKGALRGSADAIVLDRGGGVSI